MSSRLQCKGTSLFLSYFKTPSVGPAPGIEPVTSRSAVKHSTVQAILSRLQRVHRPLILLCLREVHRLLIRLSNPVAVTKGAQVEVKVV